MNVKQVKRLGIHDSDHARLAVRLATRAAAAGVGKAEMRQRIGAIARDPSPHVNDEHFGELAAAMAEPATTGRTFEERSEPAPCRQWGDDLEPQAVQQMRDACRLPVAVRGALMPDAHLGYGLPIGGVLATDNAVIPYAVGVDIACRVRLTVLELPTKTLQSQPDRLVNAIEKQTRFGIGAHFRDKPREHPVMDADWTVSPVTQRMRDRAWAQLGTSGSGNHFVEFGVLTVRTDELGLPPGEYLALLSHSGSRGAGAEVARHYSTLARKTHPQLPKQLAHLAWLGLDTHAGQEYWAAMRLMGNYAAANHELIHHHVVGHLGVQALLTVENHHNFAWKEVHDGNEVIVHRKGATPAGVDDLGIIPGSMATPAYVVRGKGSDDSLRSASHGAGRVMSRRQAKLTYRWAQVRPLLAQRGVRLLSAGLDEVPFVYKDIDHVMQQQHDLVRPLARFDPKLVKMAPPGERAED